MIKLTDEEIQVAYESERDKALDDDGNGAFSAYHAIADTASNKMAKEISLFAKNWAWMEKTDFKKTYGLGKSGFGWIAFLFDLKDWLGKQGIDVQV